MTEVVFVCLSHFYISGWLQKRPKRYLLETPSIKLVQDVVIFYVFLLQSSYEMSSGTTLDADRNLQGRLQRCIWWCDIGHNSHVFIGCKDYSISTYIYHENRQNVGKYIIDGCPGMYKQPEWCGIFRFCFGCWTTAMFHTSKAWFSRVTGPENGWSDWEKFGCQEVLSYVPAFPSCRKLQVWATPQSSMQLKNSPFSKGKLSSKPPFLGSVLVFGE